MDSDQIASLDNLIDLGLSECAMTPLTEVRLSRWFEDFHHVTKGDLNLKKASLEFSPVLDSDSLPISLCELYLSDSLHDKLIKVELHLAVELSQGRIPHYALRHYTLKTKKIRA